MYKSTSKIPQVISEKLCAIYDTATGDIIHMHKVTTLAGSDIPTDEIVKERAMEQARRLSAARIERIKGLKATLVDPESYQQGFSHKIDLKTCRLIAGSHINDQSKHAGA